MIIGEAATKLPDEYKNKAIEIPWRTIIGFRNLAIHEYANVAMNKVWEIYLQDLPHLYIQLKSLLAVLPPLQNPEKV